MENKEDVTDKNDKELKCEECNFVGNSNVSLKKHINAKHAPLPMDYDKEESHPLSEGVQDLFQIEVLEGVEVFACNVCDEGFDKEDEVSNHIIINQKDILIQISNDVDSDEKESCSEESFGDSWLDKFDEDGNRIG